MGKGLGRTERLQTRLQDGQQARYIPATPGKLKSHLSDPIAKGRGLGIDKGTKGSSRAGKPR